jgi:peptidoglycan/xylan/chitin deacetylase (PgdA/CDA1 family)
VPDNYRESATRLAAAGLYWSGAQRAIQGFSRHFEITHRAGWSPVQRARVPKVAIICHHRIGNGGVPYYSNFSPEAFEAQIRFLRKHYRLLSMDDVCRELDEKRDASQAVAITFDDGYSDLYTHAFPILRRYGVPATVYLTAEAIESGEISWYDRIFVAAMATRRRNLTIGGDQPRTLELSSRESRIHAAIEIVRTLRGYSNHARIAACKALEEEAGAPAAEQSNSMLSWTQIREMQKAGISFGAHTMTHPVVGRLSESEYQHELVASRDILEDRLQMPVEHFAYPFGTASDIDDHTPSLMSNFGYRSSVSMIWGVNTPATDRYLLRRIGGESPSLPQFALDLRRLFLTAPEAFPEIQLLEHADHEPAPTTARDSDGLNIEVKRA